MSSMKRLFCVAVISFAAATSASAQTTTGTISGRIVDSQDLSVPGVTITVSSPALQGIQTAVSSENGDYIVALLPPGTYLLRFELSGFQTQEKSVSVAATQTVPLNVTIGPAAVEEAVVVVGQAADVLTRTAQVATNFKQDIDRDAADHPRYHRHAVDGAVGPPLGTVRGLHHCRCDVL